MTRVIGTFLRDNGFATRASKSSLRAKAKVEDQPHTEQVSPETSEEEVVVRSPLVSSNSLRGATERDTLSEDEPDGRSSSLRWEDPRTGARINIERQTGNSTFLGNHQLLRVNNAGINRAGLTSGVPPVPGWIQGILEVRVKVMVKVSQDLTVCRSLV